ncbi:hypothetical protein PanNE5_03360 [Pandoraea sp. NE5]|uniref:hypothetical protein n=1 Tax=Pandoraea sp. NE5 TaxID=2904129 RepID=UPI0021C354E0|nr:hypothetical protein [Pandoraea sp. NE5]BDD90896.1 hypothetical protein PanNE5_03360 [Pandoraea sp. NE5]
MEGGEKEAEQMANITEELLLTLKASKKTPVAKWKESSKAKSHWQAEMQVEDADGNVFRIYQRQNAVISDNFSCGIVWLARDGSAVPLARYNGADHPHSNPIEGTQFAFVCHIHVATERYGASAKPDKYAEETDRYSTLAGALATMVEDYNISGLEDLPGQGCLI